MLDVVWENKMKCTLVVVTVWLYLVTQNNKVNQEIYVLVTFCPTITNNVCAAVNGKWSGSVKKINYFHSMISSSLLADIIVVCTRNECCICIIVVECVNK